MSATLLTPVREVSSLRFGDERLVVPFDSALKLYPRWSQITGRLDLLAETWPTCVSGISKVSVSRRLKYYDYAEARTTSLVTVAGQIVLSRGMLTDPAIDSRMLGMYTTQWCVGSSVEDIVTHEFGHLLIDMACACYYKHFKRSLSDFYVWLLTEVERNSGYSQHEFSLSEWSEWNDLELLAEAFVDAEKNGVSAHPFSQALRELLFCLWADIR